MGKLSDIKYIEENDVKTAVIPMDNYKIYGTATVHLNYDDLDGWIEMKPYFLPPTSNLTDKEIFENCNDGGFGYVDILGIHVMIFENYDGHEKFIEERKIDKQLLEGIKENKGIDFLEKKKKEVKEQAPDRDNKMKDEGR